MAPVVHHAVTAAASVRGRADRRAAEAVGGRVASAPMVAIAVPARADRGVDLVADLVADLVVDPAAGRVAGRVASAGPKS